MQNPHPLFIKTIKEKLPKNISIIEVIANILNINYDAAYRRVNGKTNLSLKDALILSKHFEISLDLLNNPENHGNNKIITTPYINSEEKLLTYFLEASTLLNQYSKEKTSLIAAYKDIPTFHFSDSAFGRKFILYIYVSLFSKDNTNISFKEYKPSYNLLEAISSYRNAANKIDKKEIWNSNTINSTIYRLLYFFKTKLISAEEALKACDMLRGVIHKMDLKATKGYTLVPEKINYELYYNDLFTLDNSVLWLHKNNTKTYMLPYAPLSYHKVEDKKICETLNGYFNKQIKYSKLLSISGEVDRKKFINEMLSKIDYTCTKIEQNTSLIM